MSSVVGSSMSQLESVTTMSTSTTKKQILMRKVNMMGNVNIEEEDELLFDSNNNSIIQTDVKNFFANQTQELDQSDSQIEEERRNTHLEEMLKTYVPRNDYDPRLPITARRMEIIKTIEESFCCIIQGGTGCGKTTQVPQYILDHYMKKKNIVI